jgi:ABC-2 type transport system ATP-binding protein
LPEPISSIPPGLSSYDLSLADHGRQLIHSFNTHQAEHDISNLLDDLKKNGIRPKEIESRKSSLEEIFIQLVGAQ